MQPIPQPIEDFNTYIKGVFPVATLPLPIVTAPRMFSPPPNADIKLILPSDPSHDLNRALINHNTAPEAKGNRSESIIKLHSKKNQHSQTLQTNTRQTETSTTTSPDSDTCVKFKISSASLLEEQP